MADTCKQQTNLEWLHSLTAEGYLKTFGQGVFCEMVRVECPGDCDQCLHDWFDQPKEEEAEEDGYHPTLFPLPEE